METNFETMERERGAVARERVLADLEALTHDAEELLKATASDVSDKAKEARSRVKAAVERAKVTCARLREQTVDTARAAAKKADTIVREHPYESMGIAFGIGLLLGAVVARR
ncbi:MAG TPA: DUF883 family protein [Verrucomicrobiae bacterium]|nr:DUF883 family protein [Verrucomicrobiae bacterium]